MIWRPPMNDQKRGMGKGKGEWGSVIKVFWSIELSDLLIQNDWLNISAIFILRWSCLTWVIKIWHFWSFVLCRCSLVLFCLQKFYWDFSFATPRRKKGSPVPPCWPPTTSLAPFRKYVTSCCPFDMLVLERSRIIIKEMNWMAWITNVLVTPYQRCYLNPPPSAAQKSRNEIPFQKTKNYNPWKIVEKECMCKSCGDVW